MASMSKINQIPNIRNFINNGLRIKLTPGNAEDIKTAAWAFQSAITSISDEHIQFLIANPNARLRIQKLKPKPSNVLHHNANPQTHTGQRNS